MSDSNIDRVGLQHVCGRLEGLWGQAIRVDPVQTVVGQVLWAGTRRPLPSSAAELHVGDRSVWIPAPLEPADPATGSAPIYLYAGRRLVFPTIRLLVREPPTKKKRLTDETRPIEYLTLSNWLEDALTKWQFQVRPKPNGQERLDVVGAISAFGVDRLERSLELVALVINFALFGSHRPRRYRIASTTLCLPHMPRWVQPFGPTTFAREAAKRLVVTARFFRASGDAPGDAFPTSSIRKASCRVCPTAPYDWGLDPVHTPESTRIRLTARLGLNVHVCDRRLQTGTAEAPQLSGASSRIPFAGYDDVRRLLMAANMQVQAVDLEHSEPPVVRQDEIGTDPPGVNLRVGYLAWQGYNHEDAWVLSESAAARMCTVVESVRTIGIRAIELPAEPLVKEGDQVHRHQLLVKRRVAPFFLTDKAGILPALQNHDDGVIQLEPLPEDFASSEGTITRIQHWDTATGEGKEPDWTPSPTLAGEYREVYRIHVDRTLPLAVGDKLANRHGHKGIVGAIIPDDQMPRWRGKPLDALIDPISVLNRSNWGQVYESLAGAIPPDRRPTSPLVSLSADELLNRSGTVQERDRKAGQSSIELPLGSGSPQSTVFAIAGIQFVMRLPHHASDKMLLSPLNAQHHEPRAQRLSEMDQWALWAHAAIRANNRGELTLSQSGEFLRRLLASAGYDLQAQENGLVLRRLDLAGEPPSGVRQLLLRWQSSRRAKGESKENASEDGSLLLTKGALKEAFERLVNIKPDESAVLVFDPPIPDVRVYEPKKDQGQDEQGASPRRISIRWLPVPPRTAYATRHRYSSLEVLVQQVRKIIRCYRSEQHRAGGAPPTDSANNRIGWTIYALMKEAYWLALGRGATGSRSIKGSWLRRQVLSRRLRPSARGVIAPGGTLPLALDEIGIPKRMATTLLSTHRDLPEDELRRLVSERRIWMKRDPVLHRWGLMPFRARLIPEAVVRLPASILGPLGGDCDGDVVAMFGGLDEACACGPAPQPVAAAWDELTKRPMYVPGKQYIYGLHLLRSQPDLFREFQAALAEAHAPPWPELSIERTASADLGEVVKSWYEAAEGAPQTATTWWTILEQTALRALARDPGMGLGLLPLCELAELGVVKSGAAKAIDLRDEKTRESFDRILSGESLAGFGMVRDTTDDGVADPIAEVMVGAKLAIGSFGGALRRVLYRAQRLDAEFVRAAQCLTEQVTQAALSVKAGKKPMPVKDYYAVLWCLFLGGSMQELAIAPELRKILDGYGEVIETLRRVSYQASVPWLEWLRNPSDLARLLAADQSGSLTLPAEDIRVRPFFRDEC